MAEKQPTYNKPSGDDTSKLAAWSALAGGDTGTPVQLSNFTQRCVQVTGTFTLGATANLEGSLDGVSWSLLSRHDAAPLTFTGAGIAEVAENPVFIRPVIVAGDVNTSIKVALFAVSPISHNRK